MREDDFIDGADAPQAAKTTANDEAMAQRRRLKIAYARVFSQGDTTQDDIDIVTQDLAVFGRMFDTTILPGGKVPTWPPEVLEGRRQVALRIMEHAGLPLDTLFRRYHQG